MIEHIGTKTVPLTEELAVEFATLPGTAGERPLKPWRKEFLASRLSAGLFFTPKWAVAWFKGTKYRVNGQHSSNMLAECNGKFPSGMKVVIDEFKVDTVQELAELFQQFDNPANMREARDIIGAHARSETTLDNIPTSIVKRAADAIAYYVEANDGLRLSKEDRARLCHTHQQFIAWYDTLRPGKSQTLASIGAAIYASWLKSESAATDFWSMVRDESHPDHEHPSRHLSRWLRETKSQKVRGSASALRFTPQLIYDRCIHAWNAYRENRAVKGLRAYADKKGGVTKAV